MPVDQLVDPPAHNGVVNGSSPFGHIKRKEKTMAPITLWIVSATMFIVFLWAQGIAVHVFIKEFKENDIWSALGHAVPFSVIGLISLIISVGMIEINDLI